MTRQNEKNLLVTVAAFATTALLVVVFQSSTSSVDTPHSRAVREASAEDGEEEGNSSYDPNALQADEAVAFASTFYEEGEYAERNFEDASERRGGKRKKGNQKGGFNPNRIRADSIQALKPEMAKVWADRVECLDTFHEIAGSSFARGDPSFAGEEGDAEHNYPGYDRTAPAVQKFIDEFECSTNGFWHDTQDDVNLWFMVPSTIPLWGDDPVSEYTGYLEFIKNMAGKTFPSGTQNKNFRYSVGHYSNWVKFGTQRKYRNVAEVAKLQAKYGKPMLSAAQPYFFKSLRTAKAQLERRPSTAAVGDNCVLVWFFHDIPKDVDEFMNPDSVELLNELHDQCTVIPFFVAPSTATNRDAWTKLGAQIVPGRQLQFGKDADYDGIFYAESFDELKNSEALATHFNNYLCMMKNRCGCRINNDGFAFPASEFPTSAWTTTTAGFADFKGVDDYDDNLATTGGTTTEGTTTSGWSTTEPPPPKTPEIDSCCGHSQYGGTPYDSELKTCCDDAVPRPYQDDGSDPCF